MLGNEICTKTRLSDIEADFGGHFVLDILAARRERNFIMYWVFVSIDRLVLDTERKIKIQRKGKPF